MNTATDIKVANPPMPTAASAVSPKDPTMAVSTKLRRFWLSMAPMMGKARLKMRLLAAVGLEATPNVWVRYLDRISMRNNMTIIGPLRHEGVKRGR